MARAPSHQLCIPLSRISLIPSCLPPVVLGGDCGGEGGSGGGRTIWEYPDLPSLFGLSHWSQLCQRRQIVAERSSHGVPGVQGAWGIMRTIGTVSPHEEDGLVQSLAVQPHESSVTLELTAHKTLKYPQQQPFL